MIYLSDKQLAERYGVTRPTIWRWVKERELPEPLKLAPRCTRWRLHEIEAWENNRPARAS